MRDIDTLNRTLRTIAEEGGGLITQRRNQFGHDWFAGRVRVNEEAVTELIGDGWLILNGKQATIAGYTKGGRAPRIREIERKPTTR